MPVPTPVSTSVRLAAQIERCDLSLCNGNKRDFLAAGEHVERWATRASQAEGSLRNHLAEIAARAGWGHHPERIINVARTIYSRLPDDVRLWLQMRHFVPVASQRERLLQALG